MKPRTRRDQRLGKRFRDAKKLRGVVSGKQIRAERRTWKRAMSKLGRRLDKQALDDSFDLTDLEK